MYTTRIYIYILNRRKRNGPVYNISLRRAVSGRIVASSWSSHPWDIAWCNICYLVHAARRVVPHTLHSESRRLTRRGDGVTHLLQRLHAHAVLQHAVMHMHVRAVCVRCACGVRGVCVRCARCDAVAAPMPSMQRVCSRRAKGGVVSE